MLASGLADRAGVDLNGYDVVDWPIGYDDLEPYYERFEWEFGVAGVAGMNPFAGPRQKPYPLPPLKMTARMQLFGAAAKRLGVSPRTYAAYVADLKSEFEVETRFQLGYEMGKRGISGRETDESSA